MPVWELTALDTETRSVVFRRHTSSRMKKNLHLKVPRISRGKHAVIFGARQLSPGEKRSPELMPPDLLQYVKTELQRVNKERTITLKEWEIELKSGRTAEAEGKIDGRVMPRRIE